MTIKHILIAEDDSEMLIMMSDFLKTKGYMISTATTESQINSVLNAKRVDLILLDVMLGFENGIQICQNIRRDSKYTEEAPLKANRTENKSISVLIDRDVLGNVIFNFDVGCKNVTYSSFCSN